MIFIDERNTQERELFEERLLSAGFKPVPIHSSDKPIRFVYNDDGTYSARIDVGGGARRIVYDVQPLGQFDYILEKDFNNRSYYSFLRTVEQRIQNSIQYLGLVLLRPIDLFVRLYSSKDWNEVDVRTREKDAFNMESIWDAMDANRHTQEDAIQYIRETYISGGES